MIIILNILSKKKFGRNGSKCEENIYSICLFPLFYAPTGVIKLKYLPLANAVNNVVKQEAQGKPYNIIYGSWKWLWVLFDKHTI